MRLVNPLPIVVVDYAWMALGLFWLVLWWRTNKIKKRESTPVRWLDKVSIWGGYLALLELGPIKKLPSGVWGLPWTTWNHPLFSLAAALQYTGLTVTIAGVLLACWSRAVLGRYWSATVALKEDHRLVQNGPYQFVRHPLYSGLLLTALGTTLTLDGLHCLLGLALLLAAFLSRARREDALMASEFGENFAEYRRRTGQIIPGIG